MPEKVVKDKVLCYVVRDGRLLVFRHTDYSSEEVGIQVPAGVCTVSGVSADVTKVLLRSVGGLFSPKRSRDIVKEGPKGESP